MKALQVVLTPREPGGHEAALFGWLADAAAAGWLRPEVHLPRGALEQAASLAGLPADRLVIHAPCAGRADASAALQGCRSALAAVLSASAPQPLLLAPGVLHAHAWLTAAAVARRRATWVYVPMTYRAQVMGYRCPLSRDRLLRPWLQRVQGWITIDDAQAAQLRQDWGVRAPVHVLPNRPRLPRDTPPAWPHPDPQGFLRVAFVGRFDAGQKGLDWLHHLLSQQPCAAARLRWHFQGRGPAEAMLRSLSEQLGAGVVQVHPHGPIDHALACSDVLLLASRYEGLPLVALEATARGWPVVATHGARLGDLLPPSSLFAFGDAAGLWRALDALRDPAARRAAVEHAQRRLAALCEPARYQDALRSLTEALPAAPCPQALGAST